MVKVKSEYEDSINNGNKSNNKWADFWRYTIGVNVIPANTKEKRTWIEWTQYQDSPIPKSLHEEWKKSGAFKSGLAVIVGKTHHNKKFAGLYLYCIDCGNQKALDEFFPNGLDYVKKSTLVEWHDDDTTKLHMYGYSKTPLPKKSSDKMDSSMEEKINANEIPAVEVKGKGKDGIMFCSPSIHKDGYKYRTGQCLVPKLTEGIKKKIDEICHKYGIPYLTGLKDDSNKIPMFDLLSGTITIHEGHNRHEAILRIAEHYAATVPGITKYSLQVITQEKNSKICSPPLSHSDIEKLCKQAIPYVERTIGLPKLQKHVNQKNKKISHVIIAEEIMAVHDFITMAKSHEILVYTESVHKYGGEEVISQEARSLYPEITSHEISEVISYIRDKTGYRTPDEFDSYVYKQNLKTGIIDIKTGKLSEHRPNYLSRIQLPVIYDNTAIPTKFLKFLKSISDDGAMKKTVIEMMALTLLKAPLFHKAFVNTGKGSNGKTVLLNMLAAVLGKENITTQTIQRLQSNRFALVSLDGKLANLAGDIDPDALKNTGILKDIIGGGLLPAEKKFKGDYPFVNFATLIFSANEIPETKDVTDGFARRFVIIQWEKQFFGKAENHSYKIMHHIGDEISGVFNIMLRNLTILLKTNRLTHEPSLHETKKLWQEKADSIEAFLNNEMVWGNELSNDINSIYTEYAKWCKNNMRSIKPQAMLSINLKQRGAQSHKTRIKGQTITKWS